MESLVHGFPQLDRSVVVHSIPNIGIVKHDILPKERLGTVVEHACELTGTESFSDKFDVIYNHRQGTKYFERINRAIYLGPVRKLLVGLFRIQFRQDADEGSALGSWRQLPV